MNERIVDSDSQFTRPAPIVNMDWATPERINNLIQAGTLSFGHKTFGYQHYTFFILLRRLNELNQANLFQDVASHCRMAFQKSPDLILYPGESTAAYVVFKLAEAFRAPSSPASVMLSPAFRQYGSSELRLEFPPKHPIWKQKTIRLLFFDDSVSFGLTEAAALKAARDFFPRQQILWLTYVVLLRGQRNTSRERPALAAARALKIEYKSQSFCTIGPETLTPADCPICPAVQRLGLAVRWSSNCRTGIVKRLTMALEHAEARSLEEMSNDPTILDSSQIAFLLYLESRPIYDVCFYLTSQTYDSPDKAIALVIFLAAHFVDVSSYLALDRLQDLVLNAIDVAFKDDNAHVSALIALAMFPTSVIGWFSSKLIQLFLKRHDPDGAGAVAALLIPNHLGMLLAAKIERDNATRIHEAMVRSLLDSLATAQKQSTERQPSSVALVEKDIRMLAYGHKDSIVRLTQNISVLLGEGRHELFLRRQLESLTRHTMKDVCINVNHVLELIMRLSSMMSAGLEPEIQQAQSDLRKVSLGSDVKMFRDKADFWLNRLWTESPLSQHLHWPLYLSDWVEQAFSSLQNELPLDPAMLAVVEPSAADCAWLCFGPPGIIVRDHFRNQLENAFHYYDQRKMGAGTEGSAVSDVLPVVKVCFARVGDRLCVIFADRGVAADRLRLFSGASGLAGARAQFSFYGGAVEYYAAILSDFFLREALAVCDINPGIYKNIFVTEFPLLLEVRP